MLLYTKSWNILGRIGRLLYKRIEQLIQFEVEENRTTRKPWLVSGSEDEKIRMRQNKAEQFNNFVIGLVKGRWAIKYMESINRARKRFNYLTFMTLSNTRTHIAIRYKDPIQYEFSIQHDRKPLIPKCMHHNLLDWSLMLGQCPPATWFHILLAKYL